jgi:hypothetical protein
VAPQDSHRDYTIIRIFLSFNADLSKKSDERVGLGSVNANDKGIQANLLFFPNSTDSTASPSFSSPKEEFKNYLEGKVYLSMISIKY